MNDLEFTTISYDSVRNFIFGVFVGDDLVSFVGEHNSDKTFDLFMVYPSGDRLKVATKMPDHKHYATQVKYLRQFFNQWPSLFENWKAVKALN